MTGTNGFVERVDLGNDEWAEISARPSHDAVNAIYKAYQRGMDNPEEYLDMQAATIAALLVRWSLVDAAGEPIPATREGIGQAEYARLVPLFERTRDVFQASQTQSPKAAARRSRSR